MVGFDGLHPPPEFIEFIRSEDVRSIILFARNLVSAQQAQQLIGELRSQVPQRLLIAVDQEGGAVTRLGCGVTTFPGNMALGAAGSVTLAREQGVESGLQLRGMGFDMNLAPVVDLHTNPENPGIGIRSLGAELEPVEHLARAVIEGHAESGVHCCLKHFPGKGAASADAHFSLPVIELPLSEMRGQHVEVFRRLLNSVSSIMTSHIVVPALDPSSPATFSQAIVTDLLRVEMGFDGLLIADDLEMGALSGDSTVPAAALKAAVAGHDLLPICHELQLQTRAASMLSRALAEGQLSRVEHGRSVARIDALSGVSADRPLTRTAKGDDVSDAIARAAIHCFVDPLGLLPLDDRRPLHVVSMESDDFTGVFEDDGVDWQQTLVSMLRESWNASVTLSVLTENGRHDSPAIPPDGQVCCLTWNLRQAHGSVRERVLELLHANRERALVVHVRNPFDQALIPAGVTALTTFGFRNCQLRALVEALLSEEHPQGGLPAPL